MITEERKGELMSNLEYSVQRFLDKQGIIDMAIEGEGVNGEEEEFLRSCLSYFAVELPEGE